MAANKKLTIRLTEDQQKQIKQATGRSIKELNIDLASTQELSKAELEELAGGSFRIGTIKGD